MQNTKEKSHAARLVELRTMPYQDYLKTQEWLRKRAVKLKIVDHRCQVCNGGVQLNVHHRTYERLGCEQIEDLTVLCRDCHALFHAHSTLAKHASPQLDLWLADAWVDRIREENGFTGEA